MMASDYEQAVSYLRKVATESIFLNQYPGQPDKPREKVVAAYENENSIFYGAFLPDGTLIGVVSLGIERPGHPWTGRNASFGISILKDYHGGGLGTRFMELIEVWAKSRHLHTIVGHVRAKNIKAIGLYIKCGFEICGKLKETALIDNQWHDEYIISKIIKE
jgi:RimJ/RimL family protein N-acetyltransferase